MRLPTLSIESLHANFKLVTYYYFPFFANLRRRVPARARPVLVVPACLVLFGLTPLGSSGGRTALSRKPTRPGCVLYSLPWRLKVRVAVAAGGGRGDICDDPGAPASLALHTYLPISVLAPSVHASLCRPTFSSL